MALDAFPPTSTTSPSYPSAPRSGRPARSRLRSGQVSLLWPRRMRGPGGRRPWRRTRRVRGQGHRRRRWRGDATDGFALGAAADEEDAVGVLLGGVFNGLHGVAHGAEDPLDGGAGDVLAGGVGGKSPLGTGAIVDAGGGGADGDAHLAGLQIEAEGGHHVVPGAGAWKCTGPG